MKKNKGFISILTLAILALVTVSAGVYLNSDEYQSSRIVGGTVQPLPVRNFLGLTDTPNSYVGQGTKVVSVNAGETALEFTTVTGSADGQFSTTSADHWKTLRDFFSTTSANYLINASSTIAHPGNASYGDIIGWTGALWGKFATSTLFSKALTQPFTRTVVVDQGGKGDCTTIKACVDYVTTQTPTATTPWQVLVMSGKYAENPFSIPAYTTVSGFVPTTWGNFDTVVIDFTSTITSGTGITMVNNSDLGNLAVKFDGFTATQTGDITLISGANKVTGVFVQGYGSSASNITGVSASVSSAYITGSTFEVDNFGAGGGTAITSSSANANLNGNLIKTYVSNHWGLDVTAGTANIYGSVFSGPSSIKRTAGTVTVQGTSYVENSGTITYVGDMSVLDEAYGTGWNGSQEVPTKNALYDKIETLVGFATTSADYWKSVTDFFSTTSANAFINASSTIPHGTPTLGNVLVGNGSIWVSQATSTLGITVGGGSGDILNGGNTTGAPIVIGTNDNFGLQFETGGVPRITINHGATGGVNIAGQSSEAGEDLFVISDGVKDIFNVNDFGNFLLGDTGTQVSINDGALTADGDVTGANLSGTNTGDQVGDGVTITGAGTVGDPFVAVSGSGDGTFSTTSADYWLISSSTIPHVGGLALGNHLQWNGSAWTAVATSTLKFNHTDLGNLAFTSSGHTGTAFRLFGTNSAGASAEYATSALKIISNDILEDTKLFYTDARVATYINASTTIAQPGGGVAGYVPMWNGSRWIASATSTCIAITGSSGLCDGVDDTSAGGSVAPTWTVGNGVISNATTTDNVGIGTTTPWGKLSVGDESIGYAEPLFAVSTSSNSGIQGQLLHIFATTSPVVTASFTQLKNTAQVVIGSIVKTYDALFVNGSIASSWANYNCDGFTLTSTALSADTQGVCDGFMFDEATAATFTIGAGSVQAIDSYGGILAVAAGLTSDAGGLYAPSLFDTQFGSSTPTMEAVVGGLSLVNNTSTTTTRYIGFWNAAAASTVRANTGCGVIASTTESNWIASAGSSGSFTYVNTGVSTTTTYQRWIVSPDAGSCRVSVSTSTGSVWSAISNVANIQTTLPVSGTLLTPQVRVHRLVNGSSIAPNIQVYGLRLKRALPWERIQY